MNATVTQSSEHELLNDTLDDVDDILESRFDQALVDKERAIFRGPNKIYEEYCSFRNLDDAVNTIKEGLIADNLWNKKDTKLTYEGVKIWYSCSTSKCNCSIQLVIDNETQKIVLSHSIDQHNHERTKTKIIRGIHPKIKDLITGFAMDGFKPLKIIHKLNDLKVDTPSRKQIENFLSTIRRKKFGQALPSLNDLIAWCEKRKEIPEDEDKVFVGKTSFDPFPIKRFRIFLTTKRLIKHALLVSNFQTKFLQLSY